MQTVIDAIVAARRAVRSRYGRDLEAWLAGPEFRDAVESVWDVWEGVDHRRRLDEVTAWVVHVGAAVELEAIAARLQEAETQERDRRTREAELEARARLRKTQLEEQPCAHSASFGACEVPHCSHERPLASGIASWRRVGRRINGF